MTDIKTLRELLVAYQSAVDTFRQSTPDPTRHQRIHLGKPLLNTRSALASALVSAAPALLDVVEAAKILLGVEWGCRCGHTSKVTTPALDSALAALEGTDDV